MLYSHTGPMGATLKTEDISTLQKVLPAEPMRKHQRQVQIPAPPLTNQGSLGTFLTSEAQPLTPVKWGQQHDRLRTKGGDSSQEVPHAPHRVKCRHHQNTVPLALLPRQDPNLWLAPGAASETRKPPWKPPSSMPGRAAAIADVAS